MINQENDSTKYVDLEEIRYEEKTLFFLRKMLDPFTIDLFKRIVMSSKKKNGLTKTSIEDYRKKRSRYDTAFLILEYQGFISGKNQGRSKPYFLTTRGIQLAYMLQNEKRERNQNV